MIFKIPDFDINAISIQGKGLKKLLVVCSKEEFSEVEQTTLQKMITAIKYDFENDIFLVVLEKDQRTSLSALQLNYIDLLVFGINPENLGFNIEYTLNEILYFDQSRALILDSIKDIKAIPAKSQQLWSLLQKMFLT